MKFEIPIKKNIAKKIDFKKSHKVFLIIISLILALHSVYLSFNLYDRYSNNKFWADSINKDYIKYKSVFSSVAEFFPQDRYLKIVADEYKENDSKITFLFENLGYKEIYSDFDGNVYFNKFSIGIDFCGIVYAKNSGSIIGIPKSYSIILDDNAEWIAYKYHKL